MAAASFELDYGIFEPLSVGAGANHVVRIAIATGAMLIAFGAVIWSRLRASRVDREGRLEQLAAESD